MKNLEAFKNDLTEIQKDNLMKHFNEVYECNELSEHELKIAYLAYLWKNDQVVCNVNEPFIIVNEKEHGVELYRDYELVFEVESGEGGGVNLFLTYEYYNLEALMELF